MPLQKSFSEQNGSLKVSANVSVSMIVLTSMGMLADPPALAQIQKPFCCQPALGCFECSSAAPRSRCRRHQAQTQCFQLLPSCSSPRSRRAPETRVCRRERQPRQARRRISPVQRALSSHAAPEHPREPARLAGSDWRLRCQGRR